MGEVVRDVVADSHSQRRSILRGVACQSVLMYSVMYLPQTRTGASLMVDSSRNAFAARGSRECEDEITWAVSRTELHPRRHSGRSYPRSRVPRLCIVGRIPRLCAVCEAEAEASFSANLCRHETGRLSGLLDNQARRPPMSLSMCDLRDALEVCSASCRPQERGGTGYRLCGRGGQLVTATENNERLARGAAWFETYCPSREAFCFPSRPSPRVLGAA